MEMTPQQVADRADELCKKFLERDDFPPGMAPSLRDRVGCTITEGEETIVQYAGRKMRVISYQPLGCYGNLVHLDSMHEPELSMSAKTDTMRLDL